LEAGGRIQVAPNLKIEIHHRFEGKPLALSGQTFTLKSGEKITVSRLAYLVSDVRLIKPEGGSVQALAAPVYINPTEHRTGFAIQGVASGDYTSMQLTIGLEPEANHSDPSQYPAGSALNPRTSGLQWSWQGGYVFMAIEGQIARNRHGFSYHIATDRNLMTVAMDRPFHIGDNSAIDLDFDVAKVFSGIDPARAGSESTHSAEGDPLAAALKNNIEKAFELAGTHQEAPPATVVTAPTAVSLPASAHTYRFPVPATFPQPDLPADNPLSVEGIEAGRRLFTDARLSGNRTQSCASCHHPDAAFSDAGHRASKGVDGHRGTRRTIPLFNLAWSAPYTWDGRRSLLRQQALAPIQNPLEMHASLATVTRRLQSDVTYRHLFASTFGDKRVTSERIGLALEQYLLTIVSADSKFDRAARGEATFTDQEKRGLLLFITEYDPARGKIGADCFHCHGGSLFSDYRFTNNGLDEVYSDRGRALVTHLDSDAGKFKTPSLRNVAITGPYMHDGRFRTLEQVIEHYTSGVHRTETLDPNIAKHPDTGMALTSSDKKALVAFLKTLTDSRWVHRPPALTR
jgi:cytochrome c peroxidase